MASAETDSKSTVKDEEVAERPEDDHSDNQAGFIALLVVANAVGLPLVNSKSAPHKFTQLLQPQQRCMCPIRGLIMNQRCQPIQRDGPPTKQRAEAVTGLFSEASVMRSFPMATRNFRAQVFQWPKSLGAHGAWGRTFRLASPDC